MTGAPVIPANLSLFAAVPLEAAMPSPLLLSEVKEDAAMGVIIGMDPHKRSATIEVIDPRGRQLAVGRFGTDKVGYAEMLAAGASTLIECGRWKAATASGATPRRLVHDRENVVDVLAKLSAQVRTFATGTGRNTDPVDAHSVGLAALYAPADPGLHQPSLSHRLPACWTCGASGPRTRICRLTEAGGGSLVARSRERCLGPREAGLLV